MKKIIMFFAAVAMTAGIASAQDINAVIEICNNAGMELEMGNKEAALGYYQSALTEAEALGEAGYEISENCKAMIPALMVSIGKDYTDAKQYDAATDMFAKAAEAAALYGNTEKADEANSLITQVNMQKANAALKAKDYATAIAVYEQILAADPTNGMAALNIGQAYSASGDLAKAEEAFVVAAANGKEKTANKQLSNIYVKKAAAALKEKKTQEAFDFAVKSNEYLENATATKVAGQTAAALGKTAEALTYLEKYVELSPNAKDANQMRYNIAAMAQKAGDKEKAKTYYQQVLTDPKFGPNAQKQLDALK